MKTIVDWKLPIKTVSEANSSEHWTKKHKRHKKQKFLIKAAFLNRNPDVSFPCTVILTRIAPRELDQADNLPCSQKYVVDAIAAHLTQDFRPGRADADKRILWQYKQSKGLPREYAVRIEIMVNE